MVKWMLVLAAVAIIAINFAVGPAAAICLGLLFLVALHLKVMLWHANRRNEREKFEFEQVNNGHADPDPNFLVRVWNT